MAKGPGAPGSARGLPRYPRRAWLEPESCRADIPTLGAFEQVRVAGALLRLHVGGLIRFLSTSSWTAGQRRLRGTRPVEAFTAPRALVSEGGSCVSYLDGWGKSQLTFGLTPA